MKKWRSLTLILRSSSVVMNFPNFKKAAILTCFDLSASNRSIAYVNSFSRISCWDILEMATMFWTQALRTDQIGSRTSFRKNGRNRYRKKRSETTFPTVARLYTASFRTMSSGSSPIERISKPTNQSQRSLPKSGAILANSYIKL